MTVDQFQQVVSRLSNTFWVRQWLNWPTRGEPAFSVMAVSVKDRRGGDAELSDELSDLGFRPQYEDGTGWVWFIKRTNDDGTPYRG